MLLVGLFALFVGNAPVLHWKPYGGETNIVERASKPCAAAAETDFLVLRGGVVGSIPCDGACQKAAAIHHAFKDRQPKTVGLTFRDLPLPSGVYCYRVRRQWAEGDSEVSDAAEVAVGVSERLRPPVGVTVTVK